MSFGDSGILLSELRHVVAELSDTLVGRSVTAAHLPRPDRAWLQIGDELLLIDTGAVPRVHLAGRRGRNPPQPLSFQGLLRARMTGPIAAIRLDEHDRILEVVTGRGTLHVRLFRGGAGMWWCEDGRAIASARGPCAPTLPARPPAPADDRPPRFSPVSDETWNAAAARFFGTRERTRSAADIHAQTRRAAQRELARLRRLIDNLRADLDATSRAGRLRHEADCLAAALHTIPRGAREVNVPDLNDPERTLHLTLDPSRPATEELRRRYDKARRLEDAEEHVLARLVDAEDAAADLAARLAAEDDEALAAFRPVDHAPPRAAAARVGWTTWVGPGGGRVLVGRDAAGNDALTFRHARGRDVWLHLREAHGAHVVIPVDGPVNERVVHAAIQLVLKVARIPAGVSADVQRAFVKDVRRIPGDAPGRVLVQHEKVVHARCDPSLLDGWRVIPPGAR